MTLYTVGILLGCVLASMTSNAVFVNYYDQRAFFECPSGQILSYIHSIHHNHYEDRRWEYACRAVVHGVTQNCQWTGYVNDYDRPLTFTCPGDKVITGMDSIHDNHFEDRLFSFLCCDVADQIPRDCAYTGDVNDWDQPLTLQVATGSAIKGATSYHDNKKEDRKWRFYLCNLY